MHVSIHQTSITNTNITNASTTNTIFNVTLTHPTKDPPYNFLEIVHKFHYHIGNVKENLVHFRLFNSYLLSLTDTIA